MIRLFLRWAISAGALLALPYIIQSIQVKDIKVAVITALVLGLVNAIIRPIAMLITLPLNILTLGLFTFVVNALLFWGVAYFVEGFSVGGFWSALLGSIVFSLISWAASTLLLSNKSAK
ncbi:MAG: putative rane protein [Pseudomonadota bacterium]|jgi:putative membrane protein